MQRHNVVPNGLIFANANANYGSRLTRNVEQSKSLTERHHRIFALSRDSSILHKSSNNFGTQMSASTVGRNFFLRVWLAGTVKSSSVNCAIKGIDNSFFDIASVSWICAWIVAFTVSGRGKILIWGEFGSVVT